MLSATTFKAIKFMSSPAMAQALPALSVVMSHVGASGASSTLINKISAAYEVSSAISIHNEGRDGR